MIADTNITTEPIVTSVFAVATSPGDSTWSSVPTAALPRGKPMPNPISRPAASASGINRPRYTSVPHTTVASAATTDAMIECVRACTSCANGNDARFKTRHAAPTTWVNAPATIKSTRDGWFIAGVDLT
jgi:hypothetical protein